MKNDWCCVTVLAMCLVLTMDGVQSKRALLNIIPASDHKQLVYLAQLAYLI